MIGLTTEASGFVPGERPAVLFLNSGVVHRIGTARNNVTLARRFADEGVLTMRFDLSGIGDSENRRDQLSMEDRAALDIRQAMDFLEKTRGVRRFVLFGLCSGADNAFRVAREDSRVVGAVLIDGYGYRTPKYLLHYYARHVAGWRQFLGRARRRGRRLVDKARVRVEKALSKEEEVALPALPPVNQWEREFPTQAQFSDHLRSLVARDVKLLFVYTGSVDQYYSYAEQLADSVPGVELRGSVDASHLPGSDHTITELHNRSELQRIVLRWFRLRFPQVPAAALPDTRPRAVT